MHCSGCGQPGDSSAGYCWHCGQPAKPEDQGADAVAGRAPDWGVIAVAAGAALLLASLLLSVAVIEALARWTSLEGKAVGTWTSVHVTGLAIAAIVWALGVRRSTAPFSLIGLGRGTMPPPAMALLAAVVLAVSLGATSGYGLFVEWLGVDKLTLPEIERDVAFEGSLVLLTFQALAGVTPLVEEIFFRGFVMGGLLPRLGPWRGIVASSLVFSGFHIFTGVGVLVPVFFTGLLLAWLYWRTGSLWPGIAVHAGQNALAVALVLYRG